MIILNGFKIPSPPSTIVKLTTGLFRLDDPSFGQPIDLELNDVDNMFTVEDLSVFFSLISTGKINIRGAVIGDTSNFEGYKYSGQGNIFSADLATYDGGKLPDGTRIMYFDATIVFARKYMLFAPSHLLCLDDFGVKCNQKFNRRESTMVYAGYYDTLQSGRASVVTPASDFDITSLIPVLFRKFINGEL